MAIGEIAILTILGKMLMALKGAGALKAGASTAVISKTASIAAAKGISSEALKKILISVGLPIAITGKIYILYLVLRYRGVTNLKPFKCKKCGVEMKLSHIMEHFRTISMQSADKQFKLPEFTYSGKCPHCQAQLNIKDSEMAKRK